MKTHLTVAEMMLKLRIPQSQYNNFKRWCHNHKDELDPIDCEWNHAFYAYNVELVREKCPYLPVETPIDAAERLANAINTSTGQNLTSGDVLDAFNRGKDYILMRRQMARTLWWVRKERRRTQRNSKYTSSSASVCVNARIATGNDVIACDNLSKSCKVNAKRAERAANFASWFVGGAVIALIIMSILSRFIS